MKLFHKRTGCYGKSPTRQLVAVRSRSRRFVDTERRPQEDWLFIETGP
jgi:hypothetical protein